MKVVAISAYVFLSFSIGLAFSADVATDLKPEVPPSAPKPVSNPTAEPISPAVNPRIDKGELLGHIKYLSSPELGGRAAGSEDQLNAALYIAGEFARDGLKPFGDESDGHRGYFQNFTIKAFKGVGDDTIFKFTAGGIETVCALKKDFVVVPAGPKLSIANTGVAFAGYGITAPEYQYDDFAGLDLAGKFALILRFEPQEFDAKSIFNGKQNTKHAPLTAKISNCVLHRAAGVLLVTGFAGREKDKDEDLLGKGIPGSIIGDYTIPVFQITRATADKLLAPSGKNIAALQAGIDKDLSNHSCVIPDVKVAAVSSINVEEKYTHNVIGLLEGSDEKLKQECLILGAHCDHVGMGYFGSLLQKDGSGKLHPGADDNASGTSGMLEIAQYVSSLSGEERPKRSILFMAYSGEEMGLLGSAFYAEHPKLPLKDTVAMLNLDMIGRSSDGAVQVAGIGSSKMWREFVTSNAKDVPFKLKLGSAADGPSDHATFAKRNIPVLFFCTGTHADYHRPSDTWDKINAPVAAQTAEFAAKLLLALAKTNVRPEFMIGGSGGYLGVSADDTKVKTTVGFPVGTVAPESPAEKAGIKSGDVLITMNEQTLAVAMDLHMGLAEYGPGDELEFKLKRGVETMSVKLTLGARKPLKK